MSVETLRAPTAAGTGSPASRVDLRVVAVQIGYPLTNVDNTLAFLRLMLILVASVAWRLRPSAGRWRASMRPVEDLTLAAEHVAATQDLSCDHRRQGNDELARLARSFNAMLGCALGVQAPANTARFRRRPRTRTPLTSLRTNIEVLMRAKDLAGATARSCWPTWTPS